MLSAEAKRWSLFVDQGRRAKPRVLGQMATRAHLKGADGMKAGIHTSRMGHSNISSPVLQHLNPGSSLTSPPLQGRPSFGAPWRDPP